MPAAIVLPPLPGDRVGAYLLGAPIGVGGAATVYQATGPDGARVALKVLHPGHTSTDNRLFRREFMALQSLSHPNVVRVLEAGRHGDYPWMAMEFVDGTDLGELIRRWAVAPPANRFQRVERLLRGLCAALEYVHARGVVHRDIKPSNVLLTAEEVPKLTDFGLAHTLGAASTLLPSAPVGTLAFMAPEQVRGGEVDSRSDLYALGVVLYDLLTGQLPFVSETLAGYLEQHRGAPVRPPSELDPRVPARLDRICTTLLQKDPAQRYASARLVLAALDRDDGEAPHPVRGRDALLDRLLARVRGLHQGRGGQLTLVGEMGSGKTTLLHELVRRARAQGLDIAHASASDAAPLDALREQMPLLGEAPRASADPVERLIQRARGRPWALVIDDVDRLSGEERGRVVELLRERVAVEGEPLLAVLGVRRMDGPAAELATGSATGLSPEVVQLPPLDESATLDLVGDHGLVGAAGAELGRRLYRAAAGAPGVVVEQIGALEQAGWLVRVDDDTFQLTRGLDALREIALPLAGAGPAPAWLETLPPDARATLEALAVCGSDAGPDHARPLSSEGLTALRALVAAGELQQDAAAPSRWRFASQDDEARVYAQLDVERRRALHLEAANGLRHRGSSAAPSVADHLQRAGAIGEAWPALVAVARHLLRADRLEEARRWTRRALDLRPAAEATLSEPDALRVRQELYAIDGELLRRLNRGHESVIAWEQSLRAAERLEAPTLISSAGAGLGLALLEAGETTRALPTLTAAYEVLPHGDPRWPAVVNALASVHLGQGETSTAARHWATLLRYGREVQSAVTESEARLGLALVALARSDLERGRALLDQALRAATGQEERRMLDTARRWQIELALAAGRIEAAARYARALGEHALRAGRPAQDASARALLALAEQAAGDEAAARRAVEQATEAAAIARQLDSLDSETDLLIARALLGLGRRAEAGAALDRCDPLRGEALLGLPAQRRALQSLVQVDDDPRRAADLAREALELPAPRLSWRLLQLLVDAATALRPTDAPLASRLVAQALARGADPALRAIEREAEQLAARWARS